MRRRTFLLAAGLLAYFAGATARVYLRPDESCGCAEAGCRILALVEHPRAALGRPLGAIEYLVAPVCYD